jgi:hypothetical protein
VPGTGEVARFPAETLGTHKDGNTEYNVTSNGAPHRHPRQRKPNKATSQYDRRRPDQSCESSSPIKPSRITCKQYHYAGIIVLQKVLGEVPMTPASANFYLSPARATDGHFAASSEPLCFGCTCAQCETCAQCVCVCGGVQSTSTYSQKDPSLTASVGCFPVVTG